MRDYFGLREHIRAALLALPLTSAAIGGCGRTDGAFAVAGQTPIETGPPELQKCIELADAESAANRSNPGTYADCPILVGPVRGDEEWLPSWLLPGASGMIDRTMTEALLGEEPHVCCYEWNTPVEGRPLISEGRAITAQARAGNAWHARGPVELDVREVALELREMLAELWLKDALAEHASIASFARTTLELIAVGAPRELVRESQIAGLDEIRHADLCFELARAYAGRELEPGPLASPGPRAADLARLAVDTYFEGCIGETTAALRAIRAEAAAAGVPAVRAALGVIARDETRHATLAWKTIAWAVAAGGDRVRAALREAERIARAGIESRANDVEDARLLAHGRLDARSIRRAEHDAWREIIVPSLAQIISA